MPFRCAFHSPHLQFGHNSGSLPEVEVLDITMIYDMKYRIDILTQISALTSALQVVAVGLLNEHLKQCVVDIKIKEATDAIARLVRC